MGYTGIQVPFKKVRFRIPTETQAITSMAKSGENLRDLPQFLNVNFALRIRNYLVTTDGGLSKRKGLKKLFTIVGTQPITMLEKFTNDIYIFGYGTTVKAYIKSTDTVVTIKTYGSTGIYNGQRYGDYFFVTNGLEKIGRISRTLNYDAQTVNYTVGAILTGTISGATAVILEDADAGVTGTLTLGNIKGIFQDNELITDSAGGSATANGIVVFTYTIISGAPICKVLKVIASRMFAGNLSTDTTAVAYSAIDTGTNPPFTNWIVNTAANDPGLVNARNAGAVNAIEGLGDNIVIFSEFGKWAFHINVLDVGGTVKKDDVFVIYRTDFGGARGALDCAKGLFYANSAGLWQLISLGQPNVPFSDQEGMTSVLLGTSYFNDIDLSNASLTYDARFNTIFLTCAKGSATNNFVIAYNTENKAFCEFEGWNINRFLNDNGVIYGAGSNKTKVWQCFIGSDDDGVDIWTDFYQELKTGSLESRQVLLGQYVQGFLSQSTDLLVSFDIYDVTGTFVANKIQFHWTSQGGANFGGGWGQQGFGEGFGGGGLPFPDAIDSFDGARGYIRNYQRIRVHVTGHDQVPHQINWMSIEARPKISIRRRHLKQVTI